MSKLSISEGLYGSHLNQEQYNFYEGLTRPARYTLMLRKIMDNKDVVITHPDFNFPAKFYSENIIQKMFKYASECYENNKPLVPYNPRFNGRVFQFEKIRNSNGLLRLFHYVMCIYEDSIGCYFYNMYKNSYLTTKSKVVKPTGLQVTEPLQILTPEIQTASETLPNLINAALHEEMVAATDQTDNAMEKASTSSDTEIALRPKKKQKNAENALSTLHDEQVASLNETNSENVQPNLLPTPPIQTEIKIVRTKRVSKYQQLQKNIKKKKLQAEKDGNVIDLTVIDLSHMRSSSSSSSDVEVVQVVQPKDK